jgi:hypothetical protein
MRYQPPENDDFDDDEWNDDGSQTDDNDAGETEDAATVPCPYCRQPVFEDAEYCANCEEYISLEDAPPERKPLWIVVTVIACLLSGFIWYLR